MNTEETIKTMRKVIKGLNDMTITHGNDREMVDTFNKVTTMLEGKLQILLNSEQEDERSVATEADSSTGDGSKTKS